MHCYDARHNGRMTVETTDIGSARPHTSLVAIRGNAQRDRKRGSFPIAKKSRPWAGRYSRGKQPKQRVSAKTLGYGHPLLKAVKRGGSAHTTLGPDIHRHTHKCVYNLWTNPSPNHKSSQKPPIQGQNTPVTGNPYVSKTNWWWVGAKAWGQTPIREDESPPPCALDYPSA